MNVIPFRTRNYNLPMLKYIRHSMWRPEDTFEAYMIEDNSTVAPNGVFVPKGSYAVIRNTTVINTELPMLVEWEKTNYLYYLSNAGKDYDLTPIGAYGTARTAKKNIRIIGEVVEIQDMDFKCLWRYEVPDEIHGLLRVAV